jgi:DNA-binding beta-propeller fold protein YncE
LLLHRAGPIAIALLLALAPTLAVTMAAPQAPPQKYTPGKAPEPNWTEPSPAEWQESAQADRQGQRSPSPGEITFTFTLDETARDTSAGVYDAGGRLIRTMWSARPYVAGLHHAIWDGKDDYGNPAPAGAYTIKLLHANVHYDWQGVLGVTEDSLAGPDNWDSTASFPNSIAFLHGKAYVAGGYNESRIEGFVFNEKTPRTVSPLNMALSSGGEFEDAVTDGRRIYFAALHYLGNGSNAVVSFYPDGRPYSFPQGTEIPQVAHLGAYFVNPRTRPRSWLPGMRGVDVAPFRDTVITGLAVERNGNLLASAHGGRGGRPPRESLDTIFLWDKNTGAALGKITGITNPQRMAFDSNGDLWVIEGGPINDFYWDSGARLVRIQGVGGKNEISEPIAGLENPVDVVINPANGHIFVADGGASQQVKEFDPQTFKLISALGKPGGYGRGAACDPTVRPTTFWLDFNFRATGSTLPWIAVDEGGDVWVGDFTSGRMLRFHNGRLVDRVEELRWNLQLSVPRNDPTRVFAGWNGMLEYKIDYSVPLAPSDPLDPAAKHPWKLVRNWYPCFLQAEAGQQDGKAAQLQAVEKFKNSQTYGLVAYHGGPFGDDNALISLPEDGHLKFVNNRIKVFRFEAIAPDGSFYHVTSSGRGTVQFTINRYAVTGYDEQNLPLWDNGTPIATMTVDRSKGAPYPACSFCDVTPSDGGIIPIFAGEGFHRNVAPGVPAFHLGGLPVNGTALQWQTMPEKPIQFPDGHGTYPANPSRFPAGNQAQTIHHDIFAGVNGVWLNFSCQFYHYRDDGLMVAQFGWRRFNDHNGLSPGVPDPTAGQALAPGFCGNDRRFEFVQVGDDYYMYVPDEGYRAGVHRWHIWNLDSIREMSAIASLGATVELKSDP